MALPNLTGSSSGSDLNRLEYDFLAASLILIMLAAIIGNVVISAVILRNRKMWTDTNMFVMNLAAGDIFVSLFCMPIPLYTTLEGKWAFEDNGTICMLNGFLNALFFIATIFTHTIISIERFVYIVKPLNRSLTRRRALYMIIAVWISSAVISLGPILGWGTYEYNKTTLQCGFGFPKTSAESLYIAILSFLAFLLPISIMTYNYIRIYWTVQKHARRMEINAIHAGKEVVDLQKQILMTFFIALMMFVILWAPFFSLITIAVVYGDRSRLPHGLGVAAYWCGFSNSACNPFILGIRSRRFNDGIKEIFQSPVSLFRQLHKWLSSCSGKEDTQFEDKQDKEKLHGVPLDHCATSAQCIGDNLHYLQTGENEEGKCSRSPTMISQLTGSVHDETFETRESPECAETTVSQMETYL